MKCQPGARTVNEVSGNSSEFAMVLIGWRSKPGRMSMQSIARLNVLTTRVRSVRVSWKYVLRLTLFAMATFVAGIYLTFAPMVNYEFFTQKVLFKPAKCSQYDLAIFGSRGREVSFKNQEGQTLYGVYIPALKPGPGTKTILWHHGIANNMNQHAKGCAEFADKINAAVFAYDYSGFGKSTGKPSLGGLPRDARASFDFLVNELHIEPTSIVQYGVSMGTGPAVTMAAERPAAGLILFAPYTSIKNVAREALPFLKLYPDFLVVDHDMESLQNIRKVTCPVLIAHGQYDGTINVHHGDQMFAAANEPKQYLRCKGAHFTCLMPGYDEAISKFMASLK